MPARQPKMKAVQFVFSVVWLCSSIIQPKRIIVALSTKMRMRLLRSYMPLSMAMRTIITDELKAYSIQRA
jgi:hypothetical protein